MAGGFGGPASPLGVVTEFTDVGELWAKTSKAGRAFYVRMNNSTREFPADELAAEELAAYRADHWPDHREN